MCFTKSLTNIADIIFHFQSVNYVFHYIIGSLNDCTKDCWIIQNCEKEEPMACTCITA